MREALAISAVAIFVVGGCSGSGDGTRASTASDVSAPVRTRLECGHDLAGSKHALRQFFSILRAGDEAQVRSVLADRPRFMWVSVNSNRGSHRGPHIDIRGSPGKAAKAVARSGGLRLRLVSFMNSEPPHRTTDFGFYGRWGRTRKVVGKAAIDCKEGKAIVLAAGVGPPRSSG
jgi:hypothetical protein